MAVVFFAVFYMDIELMYKIFMAVLALAIIFLLGLADEAVKELERKRF
jgi:hypothetical protein